MKSQQELERLWKLQRANYEREMRKWAPPSPTLASAAFGSRPGQMGARSAGWYSELGEHERKAWLLRDLEDERRLCAQERKERLERIPREGEMEGLALLYGVVIPDGNAPRRYRMGCFKGVDPKDV